MDRKSIIALIVCFLLMMLWYPLINKLYPPKPLPPGATNILTSATNQLAGTTNRLNNAPPALAEASSVTTPAPFVTNTNAQEELLELTNATAHYTFTSHGGGLKLIELLRYPETVAARRERKNPPKRVATLNNAETVPVLALLDGDAVQGDGIFNLSQTGDVVHAEKTLPNGLRIVKRFELSSNYLVMATIRLENTSSQTLTLPAQEWVVGTATPMGPRDNGLAVGVLWYNGARAQDITVSYFSSRGFLGMTRTPPSEFRGGSSNVVWVAAHNQFFALAAMPQDPAQSVVVRKVELPRFTGDDAALVATNAPPPQGCTAALVYPSFTLTTNQVLERKVWVYAGPKEYQTLAAIGERFNNNLDLVMNFGWSGFVSKALLLGMNWMHNTLRFSYGWAIIAITIIIKVAFWPLTQASTRSMKRMQALQPQMNALREKYKDDPVKMNRKMMEFMKEHKVSPLGGCLPMVLQIPVFFGFYRMIQSAIELRGAPFLWVSDLSQPDTLFIVSGMGFVPFFGIPGVGLPVNLLPLIMGATMLWQARLTPPSPGMDPMQAKIMRYMPLLFMVFLYNFSAGLTLYWTVQNLLTIAQTKLTKTTQEPQGPKPPGPVLTAPQKKRK
jgi:YidC/Oxa1 family membrane protein insertase